MNLNLLMILIYRHCNDPIPAFGGKECPKDPKYEWESHRKAELDKTECITEMNKGTYCQPAFSLL